MAKNALNKKMIGMIAGIMAILLLVGCNQTPETPGSSTTASTSTVSTQGTTAPTTHATTTVPTTTVNLPTGHVHNWVDEVTEPTCTEDGYTTHRCECGESYIDNTVKTVGHDWKDATCSAPKSCAVCGAKDGRPAGHQWDDGVVTKDATEESDGEQKFTCTVCGEVELRVIPSKNHEHSYDNAVVTPPTCTEKGYTTHTCRCGDSYTDSEVKAAGHDWKDATCTAPRACKTCGITEGSASGHSWKDATCSNPKTCSVCGVSEGSAKDHSWKEATCTVPKTCSVCGATEGSANGHNWKVATCTKPKTCMTCDATEGEAKGHSWKNATCTTPKTCSVCGVTEGSAKGHSYNSVVTPPTETERGYTTHTCTACGDSYVDSYTDPVIVYETGTFVFSADGVARLYGDNNQVYRTYTGWTTAKYTESNVPWNGVKEQIKKVIIENGVSPQYTDWWFRICRELTSVTLGNSVTNIGIRTFDTCSSLASIIIPNSVTSIGRGAFGDCTSLTEIMIPKSVTSISEDVFSGCAKLASMAVAAGNTAYHSKGNCIIETASKTLIAGCNKSVIPDDGSVMIIGNYAFRGCENLSDVVIPNGVTGIGEWAFYGCSSITRMIIPEGVTSIGGHAFQNCSGLTSVSIPIGVTSINDYTFGYCDKLSNVTIPDGVTSIGTGAFRNCEMMSRVTIPDSVKIIGEYAFYSCNMNTVIIGNGVTNIGLYAFTWCSNLYNIEFNGTTAEWIKITKGDSNNYWKDHVPATYVQCTDGQVKFWK